MRNLMRFLLISAGCLTVLSLGLYASNHAKVNEWLRSFGSKPHVPGEIVVRQRSTIDLPSFDGAVRLRVGDIKRGQRADIEILGPGSVILAANRAAEVGDSISFNYAEDRYSLHILKYVDEIGSGDFATFDLSRIKIVNTPP